MDAKGPKTAPSGTRRIESVDILRGITMLVMIFVNDLAGVKGLPWWNYHMPANADAMTYVDVVFPVFLFIVGLSIPLAVRRRIEKGDTPLRLWIHIIGRAVSLAVLGILIANSGKVDPALTGISGSLWATLVFAGVLLFWNSYPRMPDRRVLFTSMKYGGLLLLAGLAVSFRRRAPDGSAAWFDFSYWEILGLIGLAYLSACILYVPFRRYRWAPAASLAVLASMNVAGKMGLLGAIRHLPPYVWPFGTGALASIVMAGVLASVILFDPESSRPWRTRAMWALAYAGVLFFAGWLLTPFGISKIRATPTWCLYCSGIATLLLVGLHWVVDVSGRKGWATFVKPAGSNTLLTYLLPDIYYAATGLYRLPGIMNQGLVGACKSAVFTALILGCAAVLTKWRVRLQL